MLGAAVVLAACAGRQARRILRALPEGRLTADRTKAFERLTPRARKRVLILGDSTAVGVGARHPHRSLAGLLGMDLPDAEVINLARAGATVSDSLGAYHAAAHVSEARFDLVVVQAGGNDVLKLTSMERLREHTRRLLVALGDDNVRRSIWLSPANVGLAPVFVPPFSWWMSARTHRAVSLMRSEVQAHGAQFVSFCYRRVHDPFSRDPSTWFAEDGLHPSDASYRWCYERALRQRVMQVRASPGLMSISEARGYRRPAHLPTGRVV